MKKIIWILMGLLLITSVSARLGTFERGTCVDIVAPIDATSNVELSILKGPASNTIISDVAMSQNGTQWNYTTCATNQVGVYTYGFCDLDNDNCYSNDFLIKKIGFDDNDSFTEAAFFIGVVLLMCAFVWVKFSRMFGSMGFFVSGLGILFYSPSNGWVGIIIMAFGFMMFIYSIMSKPRR